MNIAQNVIYYILLFVFANFEKHLKNFFYYFVQQQYSANEY